MEQSLLTRVFLPVAIVVIMFGLGLTLAIQDFARIARYPRAAALGLTFQLVALPIVAYAIVGAFGMPPALGMGLMILALSPAGSTSNMITFLAKGDVALAVTLTALTSIVTVFSMPLMGQFFMSRVMGTSSEIAIPVGQTMLQLVAVTLAPVAIGMAVRRAAPGFAERTQRPFKIASAVLLVAIIAGVIAQNRSNIGGFFASTGLPALTLNVAALTLGYFGALAIRVERTQAITLGIEIGIHNGTMALFVTGTVLNSPEMSITPAIYSLVMLLTAPVYAYLVNAGRKPPAAG
jgi:BASS family bile acid:Na+ symporter